MLESCPFCLFLCSAGSVIPSVVFQSLKSVSSGPDRRPIVSQASGKDPPSFRIDKPANRYFAGAYVEDVRLYVADFLRAVGKKDEGRIVEVLTDVEMGSR